MLGYSKHSMTRSYHDYRASPEQVCADIVSAYKTVPLASDSWELRAPVLKKEIDRGSWLVVESWSSSKDLFHSVHPCQTDCICGLGLSWSLPRDIGVAEPRDTRIRRI